MTPTTFIVKAKTKVDEALVSSMDIERLEALDWAKHYVEQAIKKIEKGES